MTASAGPSSETSGNGIRRTLAIASGKGGVGKSTVSVNLAVALARRGGRVGLLDADLYGPSIPQMTGISRMPRSANGLIEPLEAHGIRLMSLGFLLPDGTPTIWRGPMVSSAIQQLIREVDWGPLDYLVVDLPPGTGDAQLTLAQALPLGGAVIVMTPQDVAMQIARKALSMFRQLQVPILGILENMSGFCCPHCGTTAPIFKAGGGRKASEALSVPFLGEIPLDPALCQAGDRGLPIVAAHPDSDVAVAFERVAETLAVRLGGDEPSMPSIRME